MAQDIQHVPDHTEKLKIFKLLDAKNNIGVSLTESMAMSPNAIVDVFSVQILNILV